MSLKRTHLLAMSQARHKINHKLNCGDNCLIFIFCPVSAVENSMLAKQLTDLRIDEVTIRIMIESIFIKTAGAL